MIAGLTALVVISAPAPAAADPGPRLAVAFASSAEELPKEAIRAAIATELGLTVIDDVHAADGVLVVAVEDDGQLTVTYRPRGPITELNLRPPRDRIDLARLLAVSAGSLVRDELVELRPERADPARMALIATAASRPAPRRRRRFQLSAVVGAGGGWSKAMLAPIGPRGEYYPGWADLRPAGILHLAPEVGVISRGQVMASLQARLQLMGHAWNGYGDTPSLVGAVLGRFSLVRALGPNLQVLPSVALGMGRVRHRIGGASSRGGGPLLVGPGAALLVDIAGPLAAVVGVSMLIAYPDPAVNVDFSTGLAWRL